MRSRFSAARKIIHSADNSATKNLQQVGNDIFRVGARFA